VTHEIPSDSSTSHLQILLDVTIRVLIGLPRNARRAEAVGNRRVESERGENTIHGAAPILEKILVHHDDRFDRVGVEPLLPIGVLVGQEP
jgi:hypothetical protein